MINFSKENKNENRRILVFHLYNDFSGSPKVLSSILQKLAEDGISIDLVTSDGIGALSFLHNYENVHFYGYNYSFSSNRFIVTLRYFVIQIYLFFIALKLGSKNTVFYVNTILQIGAVLAGRLLGTRVVYHYHENAFIKSALYRILAKLMQKMASDIICVSDYQRSYLNRKNNVHTVPNALTDDFVQKLRPDFERGFKNKNILMLFRRRTLSRRQRFIRRQNNKYRQF